MASKCVLAIGLDPHCADLSAFPGITAELVAAYVDEQIARVRSLGFEIDSCLVDRGATAERVVETALREKTYDCVLFGAGLREPPDLLLLFEAILNLVHRLAPESRIAFNTSPEDTLDAVRRSLG
jgi:hypothetical protein